MQFTTGNPGKAKGCKNATTKTYKRIIASVFEDLQQDPETSLKAWAKDNPKEFYRMASKIMPSRVKDVVAVAVVAE